MLDGHVIVAGKERAMSVAVIRYSERPELWDDTGHISRCLNHRAGATDSSPPAGFQRDDAR